MIVVRNINLPKNQIIREYKVKIKLDNLSLKIETRGKKKKKQKITWSE
jgi:hypothetical protein